MFKLIRSYQNAIPKQAVYKCEHCHDKEGHTTEPYQNTYFFGAEGMRKKFYAAIPSPMK